MSLTLHGHQDLKMQISEHYPRLGGHSGKESTANAGDVREASSIPGSGRSPWEGNGSPLQYSCLENPTDRGAWRAIVHGVTKSQTRLSTAHFTLDCYTRLSQVFTERAGSYRATQKIQGSLEFCLDTVHMLLKLMIRHIVWYHLYEMSKTGKSVDKVRLVDS